MDFRLTEEQEFIRETITRFVANECPREMARELDAQGSFPRDLLKQIAALGFCALNIPEEYGGAGSDLLGSILVVEQLATVAPVLAGAFAAVALRGGRTLAALGSDEQKKRLLPAFARGETLLTFAISEGREPIETTAVQDGGAFVVNGAKKFVALADEADAFLTLARTTGGLSFFIVAAHSPGLELRPIKKVGTRGASLCAVRFQNVLVPGEDILGGMECLNRGHEQLRSLEALERIEAAALSLGIAQGAYDYAVSYARERIQFGKPIASFEAIQHMLVDVAIDLRASRLLLYQACSLADQGAPFALEAAVAKSYAVQAARRVALQCVHILGGYGYMMEYDAQRYARDALSLLEGSESTETLKTAVGAWLELAEREAVRA